MKQFFIFVITTIMILIGTIAGIIANKNKHYCKFGEWEIVQQATCTVDGLKERVCECGKKESQVINASHTMTKIEGTPATEHTNGSISYNHCTTCDKNFDISTGEEIFDFVTPSLHTLINVKAKPVTEHINGNIAHIHCEECNKDFDNITGEEIDNTEIIASHINEYDHTTMQCTACNKYVITTKAQLENFRDNVNSGNKYNKQTVVLDADIDLENSEWTPITGFYGTFDGQNHTIKNLKISSGNDVGLFGRQWQINALICNFTIDGANINGGQYVGVALAATASTIVDNVTVKNAVLTANHWVGGIVGYAYSHIRNCTVKDTTITCIPNASGTTFDNGDKAGGIVGQFFDGTIENCSVDNLNITAFRDVGGIVGTAQKESSSPLVKKCTVTNSTITLDKNTNNYTNWLFYSGEIVGRSIGCNVEDNVFTNVQKITIDKQTA